MPHDQERLHHHPPAGDDHPDGSDELGKDEDEEKSAQQLKHHGDERPLAQVADEVVHDDPEQDGPTDDEGQCDHGVDEELAVAKQRRDPHRSRRSRSAPRGLTDGIVYEQDELVHLVQGIALTASL
jgi:hypothetical protein